MMGAMPTEDWHDDDDGPSLGIRLDDEDLGTPWSNLYAGCRVRFKTQQFVKRGTIVSIKKRSMIVQFDAHATTTTIPDAKWYYLQARMGNHNEHMVNINTPPPKASDPTPTKRRRTAAHTEFMTPSEAAARLGTDPKNIRRMIRSGKLEAHREGGRWVLTRAAVEALA